MKFLLATGLMATTAVAFAGDECCPPQQVVAHPTALIKNANPAPATAITGTLEGMAKFDGERPKLDDIEITAEKSKGCVESGDVDNTNLDAVISKDGGVANVVVSVEVKGAEVKALEHAVVLDQKGCRFEPHVVCVPTGTMIEFKNSDSVSHNVHTYPKKNAAMNKTIPANASAEFKVEKTDEIAVKCDIHPWMKSHLIVTDTPFMAVTGADGKFSIEGLPAGEHKVEWWHETLGKGKGKVNVGEDGKVDALEIKLSAEKKKKSGRRRG